MPSTKRSLSVLVGTAMFAAVFAAQPARASELDRLLELLVGKGVVTREEATALREEVAKEQLGGKVQAIVEKQNQDAQRKEHAVTGATPIKLSGWVQARWTNAAGTTNPLELRRARLALDGSLAEKISYRVQADAVRSPVLLDARLDFNSLPYAKLTVGQFKIPFSQENLISSRDLIPIERSLVVNNLVPGRDIGSNGRDIGAQLAGNFQRADGRPLLDYSVGVFNGAGINRRDDNRRKDVAAWLAVHPTAGLLLAGDYYNGATGTQKLSRERAGVEFAYVRKLYSLRGEYIWGHDDSIRKGGWYTQFAYRFRPQWEGLFRFDNYDPNRRASKDTTNTYLVGLNWHLSKWVKFQADYGVVDEEVRAHLTHTFLTQVQFQY